MTRSPPDGVLPGDARAGYVLIEVAAALALTLLLIGFGFPFVAPGTTSPRLLALAGSLASVLRDARTAAIAGGAPVAARYDAQNRELSAGAQRIGIPPDVRFDLVTGGNCPADEGKAAILFRPDGSNCGGVLRFAKDGRVMRIRVNWSDGHVEVLQGG